MRRRRLLTFFSSLLISGLLLTSGIAEPLQNPELSDSLWGAVRSTAERYLGRPYVWGAVGLKSFDCSGFIWRVMFENGILIKRTTARKLYMSLPRIPKGGSCDSGALVFFNNLKHVGLVNDRDSFYHAQVSMGTNLSAFDPYWRRKICGFRRLPIGS